MTKITCTFYNKEKEYAINENNIASVKINCQNNAIITTAGINIIDTSFENCKIEVNSEVVFDGYIYEINDDGLTHTYTIKTYTPNVEQKTENDELIRKFRYENPDLFQPEIYKSNKEPICNIDQWIIKDTLKTKINKSQLISVVNLHIKASWLRCVYGQIDLTNKLKFALLGRPLETFTPNKLNNSWFKTFDLLRTDKSARQTKYFISHSKLIEESTVPVTFSDKFTLNRTAFNYELSLGWEYEQLENEEIQCKIINNNGPQHNVKDITIDLHNVQEYLPDAYKQSFFKTNVGLKICNIILNEIIKYIKNSMYNIYVQFRMPICADTPRLSLYQPIKINNTDLYVRELEYIYEDNGNYINVTCVGSKYKTTNDNEDFCLVLPDISSKIIRSKDIIDKIIIQNDADTQYLKLIKFCANTKGKRHEIMKKEINDALNKYQTRVIIKTRPLKTSYTNKTVYETIPINLM